MFSRILFVLAVSALPMQTQLPEGAAGLWARDTADCTDGPRIEVSPDATVLRNGSDVQRLTGLDVCYSCFAGAQEESSVAMIQSGYEEATLTNWSMLYYDSAAQTVMADFRDNADKALNRRFPLQDATLIRCPAS